MKHWKIVLGGCLVATMFAWAALVTAQQSKPVAAPPAAKADMKQVSYIIGMNIGRNMKEQEIPLNVEEFVVGLRAGLAGEQSRVKEEDVQKIIADFQNEMTAREEERTKRQLVENKKAGEAFLAKNKTQPGVVTTKSGLQYQVLKPGIGKKPTLTDTVSVHYRGTFIDGKEFDSSHKHGQPADFGVGRVIPGFTEALTLMKEGATWKVFIPSHLAYGEAGRPGIEPNAVLIFELELIKIKVK